MRVVARYLALQLFAEQDAIYLPPRRRPVTDFSPTGVVVSANHEIPATTVKVLSRSWIDDSSVLLHVEGERDILVTIRSKQTVDEHGNSSCVLSLVGACNPAIANWDSEQIRRHLCSPDSGMDWLSHWSDAELDSQNEDELADQMRQYLGDIPSAWLDNLQGKQVNETVLHWIIKKTVSESGRLTVPPYFVTVRQTMPDGSRAEDVAKCNGGVLLLEDIRLERRFGNMVPDVMCNARRLGGSEPTVALLIEAAVTNYIDEEKRRKIVESGVACIQIRADLFPKTGYVLVSEIAKVICSSLAVNEWIVHPWIGIEIGNAKRRLASRSLTIQRTLDAEAKAKSAQLRDRVKLEGWIASASNLSLARGYLKALKATWRGHEIPKSGLEPISLDALWKELRDRKLVGDNQFSIESPLSLLRTLTRIKELAPGDEFAGLVESFCQDNPHDRRARSHSIPVMFALQERISAMSPVQAESFQERCKRLRTSLDTQWDESYARSTEHDSFYSLLFPEIASSFNSDVGTKHRVARLKKAYEEDQLKHRRVKDRRDQRVQLVKRVRSERAAIQQQKEVAAAKACIPKNLQWLRRLTHEPSVAVLYATSAGKVRLLNAEPIAVLKAAIASRDKGRTVAQAIQAIAFESPQDVLASVRLLEVSNLCAAPG